MQLVFAIRPFFESTVVKDVKRAELSVGGDWIIDTGDEVLKLPKDVYEVISIREV